MIIAEPKSEPESSAPVLFNSHHELAEARHPKRGMLIKPSPLYRAQLKVRIKKIMNAILDEVWAPIGLRCHLVEFIDALEYELYDIEHRLTVVMWQLHSITQEFLAYQNHYPDSELIAQMKSLDQEINSPDSPWMLYPELCAS